MKTEFMDTIISTGRRLRRVQLAVMLALGVIGLVARASASETDAKPDTSPIQMSKMDFQSDLKKIDQQWAELEKHLQSEDHFKIRVQTVSLWSVGQQVGHVAKTIEFISSQLEAILANPTMNADLPAKPISGQLLTGGEIPRGRGKAPVQITYPLQPKLDDVKAELAKAKERWSKLAARSSELQKAPGKFVHFALGPMTCTDWVRFTAVHTAHHLKIINDILAKAAENGAGATKKSDS